MIIPTPLLQAQTVHNTVYPASYFSHGDGYMLLGFDKIRNENDFIADYAADTVISIQRTDSEILYSVTTS